MAYNNGRMRICALASGSKGNCVYVDCGGTRLLIDCGVTQAEITSGLSAISNGADHGCGAGELAGVLITHEHSDHIKSAAAFSRRYGVPVYGSAPTLDAIDKKAGARGLEPERRRCVEPLMDFYIGDINITPFKTPHDAAYSLGYRLDAGRAAFAVATDIGCLDEGWLGTVEGCQVVMLEANHDVDMLNAGPYPDYLKRRILSRRGHLSNDDSAKAAVRLAQSGTRVILLSHLSETNNTPRLAYGRVCAELERSGIRVGEDVFVSVLKQHSPSEVIEMECE